MRFLSPLHRLICIFHRLLRMLMPCLVVFFPVVGSGRPVCVRRQFVEFGCSLVRVIWHGWTSFAALQAEKILALHSSLPG